MKQRPLPLYVSCALLLVLAVVFGIGSMRLGLWQDGMPGPGLLPGIGALLLAVLLALLVWRGALVPDEEFGFALRPFLAIGVLLVYAAVVPRTGFVPATVVMVTLWSHFFHEQGWLRSVVLAVVLVAACVLLFKTALEVPMPLFPGQP